MFFLNKSIKTNGSGLANHAILSVRITCCDSGVFPRWRVCPCVGGIQNRPLSVFLESGRKGCALGTLFRAWGWRASPYARGRCIILWPLGKVAAQLLPSPQASLASTSSIVVGLGGTDSQDLSFSSCMESTGCVLNDQRHHSSLAF